MKRVKYNLFYFAFLVPEESSMKTDKVINEIPEIESLAMPDSSIEVSYLSDELKVLVLVIRDTQNKYPIPIESVELGMQKHQTSHAIRNNNID